MKRYLLLVMLILSAALNSVPVMSFETDTYDFKEWKEVDGPFSYTYNFTNTGDEPLVISKIQSGCGCSSTSWSTGKIMPGKKGFVKVDFNPKRQAGRHNKRIKIYANTANEYEIVTMKGHITGAPRKKRKPTRPVNKIQYVSSENAFDILVKHYNNSIIIDASPEYIFEEHHIYGAVNLDVKSEKKETFMKNLSKKQFFFVYANEFENAATVAERLAKFEDKQIFVLEGGFKEWQSLKMDDKLRKLSSEFRKNEEVKEKKQFRKSK